MDTGADISIIAIKHWPHSWPLKSVPTVITGIGTMNSTSQSSQPMLCKGPEQQTATLQPLIADIPISFGGEIY